MCECMLPYRNCFLQCGIFCDSYPYFVLVKLDTLLKEFVFFNTSVIEVLEQHRSPCFTTLNGSIMHFTLISAGLMANRKL